MLTLLKLIQALVRALNSDGTPSQVAAGIALGAALGLTPLLSLHNLFVVAPIVLLNVSVPGAILGWLLATPLGFALDPVFDTVGRALLLDATPLAGIWAGISEAPVLALANLNNSVVLGSLVGWAALALPIYAGAHVGVRRYRATLYPRVARWKVFQAVKATKLYTVYRMLQP